MFYSELSAKVAVLRDMLLFREDPNLCVSLFDTDEIATAIPSVLSDNAMFSLPVLCISVSLLFLCFILCFTLCCILCTIK